MSNYTNIEAVIKYHAANGIYVNLKISPAAGGGYVAAVHGVKLMQGQTIDWALQNLDAECKRYLQVAEEL